MSFKFAALISFLLSIASVVFSESAVTTRYWDCCKPSCAWPGKAQVSERSACGGGNAYACSNNGPWAVNDNLAYGFAAAKLKGRDEKSWCCACYECNHFDLAIPGGGVGWFQDGCRNQSRNDCYNLPAGMFRDGCFWRFDWFKNADNPSVDFHEVSCPQAMIDRTHCGRWG
ncbi:RlpA-like double-psi beta-barrel-protein domain-containing protein-containing protein [Lophiotrema nucula]|uniref:Cellulase n=1 Tax=Lophiotrema nucula TaxID=690887 RepID=A0A6A5ZUN6_9PLEO|nr:RlpA-like double-psi beta-barrel-protein domain-containing protein-containing protein [Lophiotrema nucula]